MSATVALTIVGATVVLGIAAAVAIVRANRRRSYAAWPRPVRWLWFGLCAALVALGGAVLVNDYVNDWGWYAALWLLLAPLAFGLYDGFIARQSSTPAPPQSG